MLFNNKIMKNKQMYLLIEVVVTRKKNNNPAEYSKCWEVLYILISNILTKTLNKNWYFILLIKLHVSNKVE